ncbi:Heavy-metal-associated domain (N-terminus) and membrane-bounded cytochrome biogenesis cycZ-like domain, possible membrane copper tolerance protein [hydrothermal vent metagenome]|uniref:Heavy-metal-associated domain (N-terminus) and membrane-bounded cytochrome biogenesis cycZ-like domain, possible membrane copper tolerance protein n=1 Tax=hydrothermal vent metagenome TaxID=652676 RepID=A0A1W1CCY4_9ZZZZ
MESVDLWTVASIAFLGAFGHCIGMCGGIVIAYSSAKIDNKYSNFMQGVAHLSYSFGRITTYVMLGAIFGAIGGVAKFNGYTTAALTIVSGIFMILAGLSLLGKLEFLTKLEHSFSQTSWYQEIFRQILRSKSLYSFYILGLLNGLLPCGLVYFFAVTAASTGSPVWGALVMLIFGASTIPAMLGLGFFTQLLNRGKLRKTMMNLAAIIVVLFGFYTIYRGYDFLRHPDKSLLNCCEETKSEDNTTLLSFEKGN